MAPYYSMKDIKDGAGKNIFGKNPDLSSTGAPYTAANPPQVTGNVGFSLNSFPQSSFGSLGTWTLYNNPISFTYGDGTYWNFTDPTDIVNYGDIVLKRANGTTVQTGNTDITNLTFTAIYLVEQRTDLASARVLRTLVIWGGLPGYSNGVVTVAPYTYYVVPWNTPGNDVFGEPFIRHVGFYRNGTDNFYTMDTATFITPTQAALTYNGYTWPTPLNGPVSTTLWTP